MVISLGTKWPGREVDHSCLSVAVDTNVRNYTSALPVCLFGVVRGNGNWYCLNVDSESFKVFISPYFNAVGADKCQYSLPLSVCILLKLPHIVLL